MAWQMLYCCYHLALTVEDPEPGLVAAYVLAVPTCVGKPLPQTLLPCFVLEMFIGLAVQLIMAFQSQ